MNFDSMLNSAADFLRNIKEAFMAFELVDLLDIIAVAFIIFAVIRLFKKSQSVQLVKGIFVLGLVYLVITIFGMTATKFLFSKVLGDVFIIFVIVFSQEIRRGLASLGKGHFSRVFSNDDPESTDVVIDSVIDAVSQMADNNVGALIVFKRNDPFGNLIGRGEKIDSIVSKNLLGNIFYPKSPLHDGAVIIENNRIVTARGVVELRNSAVLEGKYGTRHRAGLVVSQQTDAFVVMVSEERGEISVAEYGNFYPHISTGELRERLTEALIPSDSKKKKRIVKVRPAKVTPVVGEGRKVSIDDPILPGDEIPEEIPAAPVKCTIVNEGDVNDEQE